MTAFDLAVLDYLKTLPRGQRMHAAKYAHHVAAGTVDQMSRDPGPCTARERRKVEKAIDGIAHLLSVTIEDATCTECGHMRETVAAAGACCTMQGAPCPECEAAEVARAEDAIEAGQARWSETGSTRR